MKGILIVVGVLGVLFLFFWTTILCIKKILLKAEKRKDKNERGKIGEIVLFIIAGIVAYEEGLKYVKKRKKRPAYKIKEEKVSLWRISERVG